MGMVWAGSLPWRRKVLWLCVLYDRKKGRRREEGKRVACSFACQFTLVVSEWIVEVFFFALVNVNRKSIYIRKCRGFPTSILLLSLGNLLSNKPIKLQSFSSFSFLVYHHHQNQERMKFNTCSWKVEVNPLLNFSFLLFKEIEGFYNWFLFINHRLPLLMLGIDLKMIKGNSHSINLE